MMNSEITAAMQSITQGVYVIGTKLDETYNLMTAAWLSQVSGRPPMIMVAVSKSHYTAELADKGGRFTVSILAADQKDVALKCGTVSGRDTDKLAQVDTDFWADGLPCIKGAAAWLACDVHDQFQVTDHVLLIGEVKYGAVFGDETLEYNEKEFF